jgi:hypothetical protein
LFATLAVQDIRNSNLAGGIFLDVPHYLLADGGLDWHLSAQLVLSFSAGLAQIQAPLTYTQVRGWHTAITSRWSPKPHSVSR